MNFLAVDVELATPKKHSICEIGVVEVVNFEIVNENSYLVQPPNNEYGFWNIRVHGIKPEVTKNTPLFCDIWPSLVEKFRGRIIVGHNLTFDLDAIKQALEYYNIERLEVEQTYCTYQRTGQKLIDVATALGIKFKHHRALSDARATAEVAIRLMKGDYLPEIIKSSKRTNSFDSPSGKIKKKDLVKVDLAQCDNDSIFYDKKVVFTGKLYSISRGDAAERVSKLGADILTSISPKTQIVVLGEDPGPSKLIKIKALTDSGKQIIVLSEEEFLNHI